MPGILLVLMTLMLSPNVWSSVKIVEAEWVISENTTMEEARRLLKLKARRRAVASLGQYLERQLVVHNHHVRTEDIRLYSAAVVQDRVLDESVEIIMGKYPVLRQKIQFTLDEDAVRDRMLTSGPARSKSIRDLADENLSLIQKIAEVDALDTTSVVTVDPRILERQRSLRKLLNGYESVTTRFIEEGTALDYVDKQQLQLRHAIRDINTNVFSDMAMNATIELSAPTFKIQKNGKYDMEVKVTLRQEVAHYQSVLDRYFPLPDTLKDHRKKTGLEVKAWLADPRYNKRFGYCSELFNHLQATQVTILVEAGDYTKSVLIESSNCRSAACKSTKNIDYSLPLNTSRYVKFKDIDRSELGGIQSLTAKLKVIPPKEGG